MIRDFLWDFYCRVKSRAESGEMHRGLVFLGGDDAGAVFGPGGIEGPWREHLWRRIDDAAPEGRDKVCSFVMLNPSTATHEQLDPTVRRCLNFARRWGYGWLHVANAYDYRATDPSELWRITVERRIDPFANVAIEATAALARPHLIVVAWGTNIRTPRQRWLLRTLGNVHCLRVTGGGYPAHPLYLPRDLQPVPY